MDHIYKHNTDEIINNCDDIKTEIKNYRKEDKRICDDVKVKELHHIYKGREYK